jgi:hypothetical protein
MRRFVPALLLLPLVACSPTDAGPTQPFVATLAVNGASVSNVGTHLTGDGEIPVRDTPAQGQAIFQLSADGQSLSYKLNVANIENVVAAHIHLGQATENGPVVFFLYGDPPVAAGGGRVNGRLNAGTSTAAALRGPLTGQPMSALIEHIRNGNAYVNVHTNDGVAPTNTGAGDFPGGEIRGQLGHGDMMH